ncbi:MAG TPA: SUMF1/EgtB/PvdO family nonheme iron enzyme [Polyangiaceae bacterium]|nr:SUMF1/EgtB/PvdO family nonheme iron enzyme [Polyangiaceae bacterium]
MKESMYIARLTLLVACLGSVVSGCKQSREATELAPGSGSKALPTKAAEPPAQARAPAPQPPSPPEGMVYVPGGSFDMGPPRAVTLGKAPEHMQVAPFFLDRTEVTVAAYLTCARGGGCAAPIHQAGCNATAKKPLLQHPMNCITKKQAEQYCAAQGKRLPSAAEWEFAARGTDGRVYPWGNDTPGEQLCWQGRAGAHSKTTCPVGSFPQGASPFGALDMAGNVAEWTSTAETETASAGAFRTRGGSYALEPIDLSSPETLMVRADQWETFSADDASPRLGVRCAKSL